MTVDTRKVSNRRKLHFNTIDDILPEVERLNREKFKPVGNWSGGQILKHLATAMNTSIDGATVRFSFVLRLFGRVLKRRILKDGMPPGYQLKGEAAEGLVPPATSWEEGLQLMRTAIRRLQTESQREPSPFLGSMTREEWDQLHCRHSELHLSFLVPDN
jgi:Protein of unknown function (DUF1569)